MSGVYTAINHLGGKNIKNTTKLKDENNNSHLSHHPMRNYNVGRNFSALLLIGITLILISIISLGFHVATIRGEIYEQRKLKDSKAADTDAVQAELPKYEAAPVAEALIPLL